MVRHVLLLRPKADATADSIEAARLSLAALVGRVHGLLDFHWSANLAPVERRDGYTHGFSMDFLDAASLAAYGPHPEHQAASIKVREAFEHVSVLDLDL
jgi:hypothetical protein